MKTICCSLSLFALVTMATGVQPSDVIINEVRFNPKGSNDNALEAVELLVIADQCNLNGLQITDRNEWLKATEDQCTLNDLGQGFLNAVPSGTLIVIYDGNGKDDTDASDFVLRFYAKSSLYCNAAPTGHSFQLNNQGDNVHLIHESRQVDFVNYAVPPTRTVSTGDPSGLNWEKGVVGFIGVDPSPPNVGFRFMGDSAELNDFLAPWTVFTNDEDDKFGKPNGGRNTEWIHRLRSSNKLGQNKSHDLETPGKP